MNHAYCNQRRENIRAKPRQAQAGYSIFDLIVTSAVAGVLGLGAVGMNGLVQDARMTAEVNNLMGHLYMARSEAIKRGQKVVLCPSADGSNCENGYAWWHDGYLLFVDVNKDDDRQPDEMIVVVRQASPADIAINSKARERIAYQASGLSPGDTATFTFCDGRGSGKAKAVILNNGGRPRISAKTSEGEPLNCF